MGAAAPETSTAMLTDKPLKVLPVTVATANAPEPPVTGVAMVALIGVRVTALPDTIAQALPDTGKQDVEVAGIIATAGFPYGVPMLPLYCHGFELISKSVGFLPPHGALTVVAGVAQPTPLHALTATGTDAASVQVGSGALTVNVLGVAATVLGQLSTMVVVTVKTIVLSAMSGTNDVTWVDAVPDAMLNCASSSGGVVIREPVILAGAASV